MPAASMLLPPACQNDALAHLNVKPSLRPMAAIIGSRPPNKLEEPLTLQNPPAISCVISRLCRNKYRHDILGRGGGRGGGEGEGGVAWRSCAMVLCPPTHLSPNKSKHQSTSSFERHLGFEGIGGARSNLACGSVVDCWCLSHVP